VRALQVRAHRLDRHAEALRDRARRQVLEIAQDDDGRARHAQPQDGRDEALADLLALEQQRFRRLLVGPRGRALVARATIVAAAPVRGQVADDGRDPPARRRRRGPALEHLDVRRLRDVVRGGAVADEPPRDAPDEFVVGQDGFDGGGLHAGGSSTI